MEPSQRFLGDRSRGPNGNRSVHLHITPVPSPAADSWRSEDRTWAVSRKPITLLSRASSRAVECNYSTSGSGGRLNSATRPSWRYSTIWRSSTTPPGALGSLARSHRPRSRHGTKKALRHDHVRSNQVSTKSGSTPRGRPRTPRGSGPGGKKVQSRSSSFCPLRGRRSDGPDRNLGLAIAICQDAR